MVSAPGATLKVMSRRCLSDEFAASFPYPD
jgi:hypothetical protein